MLSLFLLPFLLALQSSAYAPGSCTGDCQVLDPSVIRRASDGKYFRFGTGGGVRVTTADQLKGPWTKQAEVLPQGSSMSIAGVDSHNIWVRIPTFLYNPSTLTLSIPGSGSSSYERYLFHVLLYII